MDSPKVVGVGDGVDAGLQESPNGVTWDVGYDKTTTTRIMQGSYVVCKAACMGASPIYIAKTQVDDATSEFDTMWIDKCVVKKKSGDRGELTITYSKTNPGIDIPEGEDPEESAPVYEVEFVRIERPIETHPRYTEGKDLQGNVISGTVALTTGGFALVEEYFTADEQRKKEICDFSVDPPTGIFSGDAIGLTAQDLLKKKLRGQESYIVFPPVVSETTEIAGIPSSEGSGAIEVPPIAADAPEGFVYLQTASRRSNDGPAGSWRRTREWTGAYVWDTDIYPTAT